MNKVLSSGLDEATLVGAGHEAARMLDMIFGHAVAQVVRCAAIFSLADHLAAGPAGADEIARAEGLDPEATVRLLRACVAFGLATFDPARGFAATPLLATLRKDDPRRLRDMAMVQAGQGHWLPWGRLDEAVRNGGGHVRDGHAIWNYFATPAGAAEGQAMIRYLDGISGVVAEEVARVLDLEGVTCAADVGGASGSLVSALLKANPALRGVVFDLPQVASEAAQAAQAKGLSDRLTFVGGDFFAAAPPADLILLKHVLHDWPDDACVRILRNCRDALPPGGRLVIVEMLLDEAHPTPFLAQFDLTMMTVVGGKERSLEGYRRLLDASGFRFERVAATATPASVLEAVPAP